jgi:DNA-binding NarL/FixJ family response regulator
MAKQLSGHALDVFAAPAIRALLDDLHGQREELHRNIEATRQAHTRLVHTLEALHGTLRGLQQLDHLPPEVVEMASRINQLSPRQRRVLEKVIAGESNKAIAYDLGLSQKTVETHRARVMRKLGASSLAQLVRIASRAVPRAVFSGAFPGGDGDTRNGARRSA